MTDQTWPPDEPGWPPALNRNELVAILAQGGISTNKEADPEQLMSAVYENGPCPRNPIDEIRFRVMELLQIDGNLRKIPNCPADCYRHSDGRVVWCYNQLEEAMADTVLNFNIDYSNLEQVTDLIRRVKFSGVKMAQVLGMKGNACFSKPPEALAEYVVTEYKKAYPKGDAVWNQTANVFMKRAAPPQAETPAQGAPAAEAPAASASEPAKPRVGRIPRGIGGKKGGKTQEAAPPASDVGVAASPSEADHVGRADIDELISRTETLSEGMAALKEQLDALGSNVAELLDSIRTMDWAIAISTVSSLQLGDEMAGRVSNTADLRNELVGPPEATEGK